MFGNLGSVELVLVLLVAIGIPVAIVGGVVYGAVRLVRAGGRPRASEAEVIGLRDHVALLERELDAAQHSIQRVADEQEFAARLRETPRGPRGRAD